MKRYYIGMEGPKNSSGWRPYAATNSTSLRSVLAWYLAKRKLGFTLSGLSVAEGDGPEAIFYPSSLHKEIHNAGHDSAAWWPL